MNEGNIFHMNMTHVICKDFINNDNKNSSYPYLLFYLDLVSARKKKFSFIIVKILKLT